MAFLSRTGARAGLVLAAGLGLLLLLSGLVSANTSVWTSQADFQAGTLSNVNATGSPGNLSLAENATAFNVYAGNPIFSPSTSGWDDYQAIASTVLQVGGAYVMWYSGTANGTYYEIGRATSTDGIHWTRNPTNGIILAAVWPYVLYEGGIYKMWFEHSPGPYQPTSIYYATSTDGIAWTMYSGNPVFSPSASGFDSFVIGPGGIVHDTSGYRMWYAGNDGIDTTYSVGLATSPDGVTWTRYPGNPIITPPFGGWWDSTRVLPSIVLPWNGELLMGYVGADSGYTQRIALATSADGITWTPYPALTLDIGAAGSWDSSGLSHFTLVPVAGNLTMWFGGSLNGRFQTGLAKAPAFAPLGTFDSAVIDSGANGTMWSYLRGNATVPASTSVVLSARSGTTATPDATWSGWYSVNLNGGYLALPRLRYGQVRVSLLTSNGTNTPVFRDLTLTYTPDQTGAPVVVRPAPYSWTGNSTEAFTWTFTDPDPGDYQQAFRLQVASDPGFATLRLDTNNTTSPSGVATLPLPAAEGTYYWRVRTEDNWGQWGPWTAATRFGIDHTAPTVTVGYAGPTAIVGAARFVSFETLVFVNASDAAGGSGVASVSYGFDGGPSSAYVVPFHPFVFTGAHFLQITAKDFAGNTMTPVVVPFYMDNNGPVVSIGLSPSGDGESVSVTGTDVGSGVATLYLSIDQGPWQVYAGAVPIDAAGTHDVRAYGVDRVGNSGVTESTTFVIANLKPYLSGGVGVLGAVLGALLVLRRRGTRSWLGAVAAILGGGEIVVAAASAYTGVLAIPPTVGLSLILDLVLLGVIAVLVGLAWLAGRGRNAQPAPPPNRGAGPP